MTIKPIKILLIEDNPGDVRLIKDMLNQVMPGQFDIVCVDRLDKVARILNEVNIDILLLDLGLPDSRGIDTFDKVNTSAVTLPIIVLTGLLDNGIGLSAVQKGAQDFLIKGQVDGNVLSRAIHYAIERKQVEEALKESERLLHEAQRLGRIGNWSYDLATHQITWSDEVFELYERKKNLGPPTEEEEAMYYPPEQAKNLREYARFSIETGREFKYDIDVVLPSGKTGFFTASMRPIKDKDGHVTKLFGTVQDITERKLYEEQLKCSYEKLQNTLFGTISALSVALEKRDPYTANHQRRVTKLACAIAEEMGLSEKQIEGLRVAGMLHDIGKIYVPAEILSKPSSLTKAEFDIVKTHVTGGYEILASVEFPWPVARIIIQHHERVDGSGYPDGLKTDNILVEAKILAVADVVEAMASHRPYRPAKGINQALDEITNNKGVLYDSRPVDACLKIFRKGDFQFDQ